MSTSSQISDSPQTARAEEPQAIPRECTVTLVSCIDVVDAQVRSSVPVLVATVGQTALADLLAESAEAGLGVRLMDDEVQTRLPLQRGYLVDGAFVQGVLSVVRLMAGPSLLEAISGLAKQDSVTHYMLVSF